MKPLFSIGMPVYNEEKNIIKTIKSIQEQDEKSFEIICVDDCSTDNSLERLNELSAIDDRIKVFHNEGNQGIAYTREKITHLATGRYFLWCDSDDLMEEGCLSSLKCLLEKHQGKKVLIIQNAQVLFDDKKTAIYKGNSRFLDVSDTAKRVAIGNNWYSYPWTFVGSTELFSAVHYPNNSRDYVDDQLASHMYINNAEYMYYYDRINYSHVLYEGSDSHNPTFYKRLSNTYHFLSEHIDDTDPSYSKAVILMERMNLAWFYSKKDKSTNNKKEVKRLSAEYKLIDLFRCASWLERKYKLIGALFTLCPSLFYFYYNHRKLL